MITRAAFWRSCWEQCIAQDPRRELGALHCACGPDGNDCHVLVTILMNVTDGSILSLKWINLDILKIPVQDYPGCGTINTTKVWL